MDLREICRDITFCQVLDHAEREFETEDDFESLLHSNLAQLQDSATKRSCRFCVLLDGIVKHKRWGHNGQQAPSHACDGIRLMLGYPEEDHIALDENGDETDYPDSITVFHSLGHSSIQILNAEVLSRSSWDEDPVEFEDSRALVGVSALEEDTSTGSDSALKLAAQWMDECGQNHASCRRGVLHQVKVPTRLVDVAGATDHDGRVFIVSSAAAGLGTDASLDARYATLSHRWTPNNPHTLTTNNLHEYTHQGLRVGDLSKTFAEACITTHKMGLRYVWIDSLCILQDSGADKSVEIPLMGDYYENAELNIAASTEDIGGLWRDREGLATRPIRLPITLELPEGRGRRRYMLDVTPVLEQKKSHLDSRGWILQERLFPLRTLFFDPYWISYDCAEMAASENYPQGILKNSYNQEDQGRINKVFWYAERDFSLSVTGGAIRRIASTALTHSSDDNMRQMYRLWYRVVKDFTRRMLTFESDRLPAISALAERMSHIVDDTYVAGIWKNDLIQGLDWSVELIAPVWYGITRASDYYAPSWSWASLEMKPHKDDPMDSKGHMMGLPGVGHADEYITESHPQVSVVDLSWQPGNAGAPFGAVSRATITLRGRPIRGRFFSKYRKMAQIVAITAEDVLEEVSEGSVVTQLGHHQDPQQVLVPKNKNQRERWLIYACGQDAAGRQGRMVSMGYYADVGPIQEEFAYLLPLRRCLCSNNWELVCLVLQDVGDGATYRRIGLARFGVESLIKAKEKLMTLV